MALKKMPVVRVLDGAMLTLIAADLPAQTEVPDLTLRWRRNRYTTTEERNCIAIAFVGDGPRDPREDSQLAMGEMVRELALDLIADAELPSEVEVEEEQSAEDLARLQILTNMLVVAVQALKAGFIDQAGAPTPLSQVALGVEEVGMDEDEDLADVNGRLVSRVNVLYRVRSEDPTVLLAPGE